MSTEPEPRRVVGFDPGFTTGMVIITQSGQVIKVEDYIPKQIYHLLENFDPAKYVIAMERFTIRRGIRYFEPTAMEIQAVVRYICERRGFDLYEMDPAQHKPVPVHVPQEARVSRHTRDAYSIAMYCVKFLLNTKADVPSEAPPPTWYGAGRRRVRQ